LEACPLAAYKPWKAVLLANSTPVLYSATAYHRHNRVTTSCHKMPQAARTHVAKIFGTSASHYASKKLTAAAGVTVFCSVIGVFDIME
jgi:hypothetical protein